MSEKTKIAWCDSTVNFWEGCTKVSAGCANCYAAARDNRFTGGKLWGKGAPRRKSKSAVKDALAFNRKPRICDNCGHAQQSDQGNPNISTTFCSGCYQHGVTFHTRRIFSLSLGDWLDDEVPIAWLAEMLDTIRQCDQVTWMLCSKRWENWQRQLSKVLAFIQDRDGFNKVEDSWLVQWLNGTPPRHVVGLCSVENQEAADKRIPQFLSVPLACRGLSMEPLLGPVDLSPWILPFDQRITARRRMVVSRMLGRIHWLIIGGESGANARPCNVDWIRSIVQQGKAAGLATFVKQLGAVPLLRPCSQHHFDWKYKTANATRAEDKMFSEYQHDGKAMWRILLTDKKGGDASEFPNNSSLRVQEWPKGF